MRTTKNRLGDPSAICALDFKGEFRRIGFCTVSGTIDIDRSIFDILTVKPVIRGSAKNTVRGCAADSPLTPRSRRQSTFAASSRI
jgi:hypothetical protein